MVGERIASGPGRIPGLDPEDRGLRAGGLARGFDNLEIAAVNAFEGV